jgi:hypothetical protein
VRYEGGVKKIPPSEKPLTHRGLRRVSEVFGFFEKILKFSKKIL